jgi:hypothetical protein
VLCCASAVPISFSDKMKAIKRSPICSISHPRPRPPTAEAQVPAHRSPAVAAQAPTVVHVDATCAQPPPPKISVPCMSSLKVSSLKPPNNPFRHDLPATESCGKGCSKPLVDWEASVMPFCPYLRWLLASVAAALFF